MNQPTLYATAATSRAAALSALASAPGVRAALLEAYRKAGKAGLSDEQAQALLGVEGNTLRPRRMELVKKGLVGVGERQGLTQHGRKCCTFVAIVI